MRLIDLAGQRFGRWTVLKQAPRNANNQTMWWCRCDCGTSKKVNSQNLRSGKSTSCGCYRDENRPNLCRRRDFKGAKNPRARKSTARTGVWLPSSDVWYKRASGLYYSAKRTGIPVGFASPAEFGLYLKSIAPAACPVFGVPFIERGRGFSQWAPSVDKINPALGYVRGNIQVISFMANRMKANATPEQLKQFASWVMEGQNADNS